MGVPVGIPVLMRRGRHLLRQADMRVGCALAAVLDQMVQVGTHPNRSRKGHAECQVARDELLTQFHGNISKRIEKL